MTLAALPPELYACILSHIPPSDRQATTLSLSRAIPLAPVPLHHLFEYIVISRYQQVFQLYRRLCYYQRSYLVKSSEDVVPDEPKEPARIRSLFFRTFQVDADAVVNLVTLLLPKIECLSLLIGTSFAPEHLEEAFSSQPSILNNLSLRFRPYVQKATYYQFLKGSYFDGTLELLSRWSPNSHLSHLSIVQEPLPTLPVTSQTKTFAQPIVFFSLSPLTILSLSPAMKGITHLRLRLPSRQLIPFITPPKRSVAYIGSYFPSLVYLDLSTCTVREPSEVEALLVYTGCGQLRHLVIDETELCNGNEREWESLGRLCALAGVRRMREREKALKAWIEAERTPNAHNEGVADPGNPLQDLPRERRPRRGRRGLATAAISLRDSPVHRFPVPVNSMTHPGGRSSETPGTEKVRVLPPPPYLMSLSASLSLDHIHSEDIQAREAKTGFNFSKGWSEGLGQLRAIWERLRKHQSNGIRLVRFDSDAGGQSTAHGDSEMLHGLVDLGKPGDDTYWEELQDIKQPILCVAGSPAAEATKYEGGHELSNHPDHCGHHIGWNIWADH